MIETIQQITKIDVTNEESFNPVLADTVLNAARRSLLGLSADAEKQESTEFEKIAKSAKVFELMTKMSPEVQRQFFEQAAAFSEFLTKHQKIVCAHHIDADGLTSTVLLVRLVAVLSGQTVASVREKMRFVSINNGSRNFDTDQLEKVVALRSEGFAGLIFVDLSPRDTEQLLLLQQAGFSLANIDHHAVNDPAQPFDVRFNPSQITGLAPELLKQMSTSALFGLYPRHFQAEWSHVDWLMHVGNEGDESVLTHVIELGALTKSAPLDDDTLESLIDSKVDRYFFAHFLNVVGATEQYNVSPSERDEYINRLLDQLFPYDLSGASIETQIIEKVRASTEYRQRFEDITRSMVETMTFLLSTAEVASAHAEKSWEQRQRAADERGDRFASAESEILRVVGENGLESLVIEAPSYRIIIHLIDTVGFTDGNVIVGSMIKPHLNQLEHQGMSRRLFNDSVSKPTTVLLAQRRDEDTFELGLYSSDYKITNSAYLNCGALLGNTNTLGLTDGAGGHADRGGGDVETAKLVSAIEYLLIAMTTALDAGNALNMVDREIDVTGLLQNFFKKAITSSELVPTPA